MLQHLIRTPSSYSSYNTSQIVIYEKQQIHKIQNLTELCHLKPYKPTNCISVAPSLISASQTRRYGYGTYSFFPRRQRITKSISQLKIYTHPTHTFALTCHLHTHLHPFRCNLFCSNLANLDRRAYFSRFVHRIPLVHQRSHSAQCLQRLRRLARLGLNSRLRRMAQRRKSRY